MTIADVHIAERIPCAVLVTAYLAIVSLFQTGRNAWYFLILSDQ